MYRYMFCEINKLIQISTFKVNLLNTNFICIDIGVSKSKGTKYNGPQAKCFMNVEGQSCQFYGP